MKCTSALWCIVAIIGTSTTVAALERKRVKGSVEIRGNHCNLQTPTTTCEALPVQNRCSTDSPVPVCLPFRSPEFCKVDESFPQLIKSRKAHVKAQDASKNDDLWFSFLDDKLASYVFTTSSTGNLAPQIYDCYSNLDQMMEQPVFPPGVTGFVVESTDVHSGKGVYVLPNGYGGVELLRGLTLSFSDVKAMLTTDGATNVIIEELILRKDVTDQEGSRRLPDEYKFHVFNGTVKAISIFANRGTDCSCWAERDVSGQRLDSGGCFTPTGRAHTNGQCSAIDFVEGERQAGEVKGVGLCDKLPAIPDCLLQDMIKVAEEISVKIGVYACIDMFSDHVSKVYVQEYSTNHLGGLFHCTSQALPGAGCLDSCFLGRMWKNVGGDPVLGGPVKSVPSELSAYTALSTDDAKCNLAKAVNLADVSISTSCGSTVCDAECPCCNSEKWPEFVQVVESFSDSTCKQDCCFELQERDFIAIVDCETNFLFGYSTAYMSYDYSGSGAATCGGSGGKAPEPLTIEEGNVCESVIRSKVEGSCSNAFPCTR